MVRNRLGNSRVIPLARVGLADLPAEKIYQDTAGMGRESDRVNQFVCFRTCFPVLSKINIGDFVLPEFGGNLPSFEVKSLQGLGSYRTNRLSPTSTKS